MPIYEFRCSNGHEFERLYRTISAAPSEEKCPECGAVAARKISGGGGFAFKGSGFYLTDYGKNAHRAPEKKTEGQSGKSSDTKPSSDTTSKPASDTGAKPAAEKPAASKPSKPKSE
jgi:putative FmdB family regulatory protein